MTYDYIKEEVRFDSPQEERDYNNHMAEFGPGVPGTPSHPDDCPYCAQRGWRTFPKGEETFHDWCVRMRAEHGIPEPNA